MALGRELLDVPFAEMVHNLALAIAQGQLELPHGCLAPARHAATPPLLQAPLGAPFGPSAHPRCGAAYLLPRLSALGCLTSFACVEPTMPSADFCRSVRADRSALSPL